MPGLIMAVGTAWKRALYPGFLFLLAAPMQRIVADLPSSATYVPGVRCWHREAKTVTGLHSLAASVGRPAKLWGWVCWRVCVCVCLCIQACTCVHTYPGQLNSHFGNLFFARCSTSSPSLAVVKSKMVGAILSHPFSKWWHNIEMTSVDLASQTCSEPSAHCRIPISGFSIAY